MTLVPEAVRSAPAGASTREKALAEFVREASIDGIEAELFYDE
jgi:hypothetical protein